MVSPNGKWLAYDSDETGSVEVYVRPFPGDGPRIQVSTDGGAQPRWSPSGKELIYRLSQRGDNALMASVAVGSGDTFSTGARREIRLPFPAQSDATHPNYDIRPGTSESGAHSRSGAGTTCPIIVYNWIHVSWKRPSRRIESPDPCGQSISHQTHRGSTPRFKSAFVATLITCAAATAGAQAVQNFAGTWGA